MMSNAIKREASSPENGTDSEFEDIENRLTSYGEVEIMKPEIIQESYNVRMYKNEVGDVDVIDMEASNRLSPSSPSSERGINLVMVRGTSLETSDSEYYKTGDDPFQQQNGCDCFPPCEFEDKQCHFRETMLANRFIRNHRGVYVCCFCKAEILEEKCFEEHIKGCERNYLILNRQYEHTARNEKRFKCDLCDYAANTNFNLQRHSLVHREEKQFKCVVCEKSFRRSSPLRDHIKIHDSERERKATCPYCGNNYYRKSAMMRHIHVKHEEHLKYQCDMCDYKTMDKTLLKAHILAKHSKVQKKYKCEYCDYAAEHKRYLTVHIRNHYSPKPFNCTYKDCQCMELSSNEKACECKPCDYTTGNKGDLKRHVLCKHSDETKKYRCPHCKYSTHMKGDFTVHLRIHSKVKPFKCEYQNCSYRSARREHLKLHIRNCHVCEKPFRCDKCNFTCKSSSNLKRHVKQHDLI